MNVIQVTFNPAKWTAGSGAGTAPGDNGYNAYTVVLDPDGMTAWAFEYFGAGFARFNLSDGSIVHQDALLGVPGSTNFLYQREDGTGMFVPSDNGFYYTIPSLGSTGTTLYKTHVTPSAPGNLFNGYMATDATLNTVPLMADNAFGIDVYNWNTPVKPASNGTRYLVFANNYLSIGAVDVDNMTTVGKWSCVYPNATGFPVIGAITSINVSSVTGPVFGSYTVDFTLTGTFTTLTAGDTVSINGVSDANFAWMNNYSFPVTSGNTTTIVISTSLTSAPTVHSGSATGTVYISRAPKSWTTFMDANNDFWGVFSLGTVTYVEDTSLNDGAVLVKWHPADGVFNPGAFSVSQCTAVGGGAQLLTGTFTGGANNAFAGVWFTITGFSLGANSGTYLCNASTATTLILDNLGAVNEVVSATATAIPRLNATPHFITAATLGTGTNGINFACYVPSNNSVAFGNTDNTVNGGWDGQMVNLSLSSFTQNAFAPNSGTLFYSGTFDVCDAEMDTGVQGGQLAVAGDVNPHVPNSHLGGILNLINPATLALNNTYDITGAILTASFLAGGTFNDTHSGNTVYSPFGNMQYSAASDVVVVSYEFVGSAVYIVSLAAPAPPTIFAQVVPDTIVQGASATLSWVASNATSLTVTEFGSIPLSGSEIVSPAGSTVWTFTATGVGGTSTATVELLVTSNEAAFNLQKVVLSMKQDRIPVRGRNGGGGNNAGGSGGRG